MEDLEQARQELERVMSGDITANECCEMVNNWLMLSCYDLAYSVAAHTTKKGRANALEIIRKDNPQFIEDVQEMAKQIFKNKESK